MYVLNILPFLYHTSLSNQLLPRVTLDTVRGQFLYELQGSFYYNPDVIADVSQIRFEQLDRDRVRVSGVKGMLIFLTSVLQR